MIHQSITDNWVYEHYLIYLCLCIADSDCMISEKEIEIIRCKSFPTFDQARCQALIQEVYKEFWLHTEEERRNYIKKNAAKYLRTESVKNQTIHHLEDLIINKDESSQEYIMFRFIRMAIHNANKAS